MRHLFRFFLVLALYLFATGCVSSSKHNACLTEVRDLTTKTESLSDSLAETSRQKDELKETFNSLQRAHDELADSNRRLSDLNANLSFLLDAKRDELTKTAADLQYKLSLKEREIDDLNREKKDTLNAKEQEIAKLTSTYDNLVTELNKEIKEGEIAVTQLKDKLSLILVEKILFDSGSAAIKSNGKKVLERVAEILTKVKDRQIRIEGHTDDVPIGPRIADRFPTNWELSTTRATNVVKFLIDNGIDPKIISATGYSEYRPVASNDSDEGKSRNRRIEIVLIPLDIDRVVLPHSDDKSIDNQ